MFNPKLKVEKNHISLKGALGFTNFITIKKAILKFDFTDHVILDVRECKLIDHSVIENLHHIQDDFTVEGGRLEILGIEEFEPITNSLHKFAALRKK